MDQIIPLIPLVGKRNTAMTIVSTDIKSQLAGITRRVTAIKHSAKRGQLLALLRHIPDIDKKTGIYYVIELSNTVVNGHIVHRPTADKYRFGDRIDIALLMEELGIVTTKNMPDVSSETVYYNQEITENLDNISNIYLYRDLAGQWGSR